MSMKKEIRTIDIIVPCYNEGQNIDAFFEEMQRVLAKISGDDAPALAYNYVFRYIFVDDGSSDDTLKKIRALAERMVEDVTAVKYISFSRNFGKEAAMFAGLQASAGVRGAGEKPGDYAVLMDADLQHPPALVRDMIVRLEETGCDSVAARRVSRKGEPKIRSVFARTFYRIMNRYCDIEIVDGAVDFRLMSRKMVRAVVNMPETQRFSKGIFAWVGFETEWIEFENIRRMSGESKWSVWGLTKYAVDGFIDFAVSPLKYVGVFGGIVSVGSGIYLIAEILKTLILGKDTPGYASTICLILFFGGIVIAILGLIGEYIGRMYLETKGRPVYVEKESNIDDN